MADKINLERFASTPLVPVPRAVRAGDYVFTSSPCQVGVVKGLVPGALQFRSQMRLVGEYEDCVWRKQGCNGDALVA